MLILFFIEQIPEENNKLLKANNYRSCSIFIEYFLLFGSFCSPKKGVVFLLNETNSQREKRIRLIFICNICVL
jgi:hypothetical protein